MAGELPVAEAFGALLAHSLTSASDHLAAYEETVPVVFQGRDVVLERLGTVERGNDVADRFRNANLDYSNIASWGSPVLLV